MWYHRQTQRERVDNIHVAEDWFQFAGFSEKGNNTCGTTKSDSNVLTFLSPPLSLRNTKFNIQKFYMVITFRLCVLRTNSDFCLIQH
jgi:hypothetical protein